MDKRTLLMNLLIIALLTLATLGLNNGYLANLVTWMAIAALVASSLRFVTLIGELNFATAAFVGIGAYAAGATLTLLKWPFMISLLVSGVLAAGVGCLFGYVTLKTKGPYFLLIGFAFTEVVRLIYTKLNFLGGNSGMVGIFPPDYLGPFFTAFALALSGLILLGLYAIERSHLGKCFIGIRDNDLVVMSVGINVHLTKVLCLSISAFAAGLAGGLTAYVNNVISPGDFSFLLSTFALAYLKVGGEDHPVGPIAGAILLVLLSTLSLSFGGEDHIFYGLAIVLTVLLMPKGVIGLLQNIRKTKSPVSQGAAR